MTPPRVSHRIGHTDQPPGHRKRVAYDGPRAQARRGLHRSDEAVDVPPELRMVERAVGVDIGEGDPGEDVVSDQERLDVVAVEKLADGVDAAIAHALDREVDVEPPVPDSPLPRESDRAPERHARLQAHADLEPVGGVFVHDYSFTACLGA